jgi:excisionase family DNA binding protein
MTQIINFDNLTEPPRKSRKTIASTSSLCTKVQHTEIEVKDLLHITLDLLAKNNPDKILFSLKEVAKQLTVGEEFIRRRIKNGKIVVTYIGDKPLINITELARIITEGV